MEQRDQHKPSGPTAYYRGNERVEIRQAEADASEARSAGISSREAELYDRLVTWTEELEAEDLALLVDLAEKLAVARRAAQQVRSLLQAAARQQTPTEQAARQGPVQLPSIQRVRATIIRHLKAARLPVGMGLRVTGVPSQPNQYCIRTLRDNQAAVTEALAEVGMQVLQVADRPGNPLMIFAGLR